MTHTSMRPNTTADKKTYQNPLSYADGRVPTNPDPFGFHFRGRYYCVATDVYGVRASWSDDLVLWYDAGYALQMPGRRHFWAPCVTYSEGLFYLYYSSAPEDSNDPHDEHLMVASAANPLGPYDYQHTFFDSFSIDPHVVRGDDGHRYMFYSTNDPASTDDTLIGTSIFVDRLDAFDSLAGKPRPVVCPTLPQEMYEANRFGDGRDWYTVEGATYIRRRDRAFVTYSGNAYVRENYFVGYSRATIDGPVRDLEWAKYPSDHEHSPLIQRSRDVEGTGHNSIVVGPNLVDLWILYHGRDATELLDPSREQRTMRMDPLFVDGGRLDTPAPTSAPERAPSDSQLADLFEDSADVGAIWKRRDGTWIAENGETRTADGGMHRLVSATDVGPYRAQVWLASSSAQPAPNARLGFIAYANANEQIDITLQIAESLLLVEHSVDGIVTELGRVSVQVLDPSAFRLLEVDRGPRFIDIRLDDLSVLTVPSVPGNGAVGLAASGDIARFSAFALTEHVDLWGERLEAWTDYYSVASAGGAVISGNGSSAGLAGVADTLALVARDDREGATTVHDFELRESQASRVVFTLHETGDTGRVTLEVSAGTARLLRVTPEGTTQISEIPNIALSFSVRCAVSEGQLTLRVGGQTVEVAVGPSAFPQRIEIERGRLCGVEITRSARNNLRKEEQ